MSLLKGLAAELIKARKPISPAQFASLLKEPNSPRVVPIDGSWFLNPAVQSGGKTGYELYQQERIPHAQFLDIAKVKDDSSPYPHMLPDKKVFDEAMSKLGVSVDDLLVVYDAIGNFSAPRALWMLQAFQHNNSLLLDNFPRYKAEGYPLETGEVKPVERSNYTSPGVDQQLVISYEDLLDIVVDSEKLAKYNLLDARPAERFEAAVPEPRPGISAGHIPGSKSLPFGLLLNGDKSFKSQEELSQILKNKYDPSKPTIATCGSGVTACILREAIFKADPNARITVYDGSWSEWGQRADPKTLVATGKEL